MDNFYALHKLLSKLPFSIKGYENYEKEIDYFFDELCGSDFITKKNNLELVSYSYAKIKKLDTWDTENFSNSLFFHALNNKYSLLVLNVYYSLRNNLFKNDDAHMSNNVAILLSRLFLKDTGFRLRYTKGKDWKFSYLEQKNIFSIKMPLSEFIKSEDNEKPYTFFKTALNDFISDSIKELNKNDNIDSLIITRKKDSKSTYQKNSIGSSAIEEIINEFIDKVFVKDLDHFRGNMKEAILFWHKSNPGFFNPYELEQNLDNWVVLFFQVVFVSLVYDSWVEYFPSVCGISVNGKEKELRNLGGLILAYKIGKNISKEDRSAFRVISSRISATVAGEHVKDINQNLRKQSLKSALAAVMARNQSHNIGSHVLSRFSDRNAIYTSLKKFEDAQFINTFLKESNLSEDSCNGNELKELREQFKKNINFFKEEFKVENKVDAIANHIAIFNNYSKERQELLAEITSTVPQLQTNKKLKAEVLKNFTDNIILLDRISGIDDFKFTFQLDIQIPDHEEDDITVGIANDVLGQQALYIILENLIRNTAKHATKLAKDKKLPKLVIFTIRVRESQLDSKYYQITIFDNVEAKTTLEEISVDDEDYFNNHYKYYTDCGIKCIENCDSDNRKTKECKINPLTKLIIDQNALINKPILDEQNELRTQGLGLIEMQACAAYLRKLPLEKIAAEEFKLKFKKEERDDIKEQIKSGEKEHRIFRAVNPYTNKALKELDSCKINCEDKRQQIKDSTESRENVLGYRFYLPKPQELLIIDNSENNEWSKGINNEKRKSAQREGVFILDTSNQDLNYKYDNDTIYPHENMLLIGSLPKDAKLHYLPKRNLIIERDSKFIKLLDEGGKGFNTLKENVLNAIVRKKFIDKKLKPNNTKFKRLISLLKKDCKKIDTEINTLNIASSDHGENYDKVYDGYKQITTHKEKEFVKKVFDDNVTDNTYVSNYEILKFLDSTLNNVLVLDERILEKAEEKYALKDNTKRPSISYREVWQNVGCFIPWKDEVDLSSSNYSSKTENIKNWITTLKDGKLKIVKNKDGETEIIEKRTYKDIDTLIIHLGVIEKCLTADGKDKNSVNDKLNFINEILGKDLDISKVNVILTSGRAPKEENLIEGCSFVTISVLTDYLIKNRFKYSLNELCNLARPLKR